MHRLIMIAASIGCVLLANAAWSGGSAESGAAKAAACQGCHGADGNSVNPEWPSLAGIGADYIVVQLQNFKDGKRVNPIMQAMAGGLEPQDMQDLAAYFDSLVNTGLEPDTAHAPAGELLYRGGDKARGIPACMACHGPNGAGNEPAKFPALRGEHALYISNQLNNFVSGDRPPGPRGIMPAIAKRLTADDIRNLAAYVQGLR